MTWLLWREHRVQALLAAVAMAALGVLLWITGLTMAHQLRTALAGCTDSCGDLHLFQGQVAVIDLVNLTVLVPVLIGVFWGVTVIGRDLDAGTNRLVWTQSITRRTWLWSKIAALFGATIVVSGLLSALVTWWSGTPNSYHHNRFEGLPFDTQGLMPVAYAVFAGALGLLSGVLWRRVLPAIATTTVGFIAVRFVVEVLLRPHFRAPLVATVSLDDNHGIPVGSWVIRDQIYHLGHVVTGRLTIPEQCGAAPTRAAMTDCLNKAGLHRLLHYQPPSRYWGFQLTESGLFLVLALALTIVAVVALRRQDG